MSYKDNIRKDLEAKRADYFENNYLRNTRQNYLRRLRRQKIVDGLSNVRAGCRILDMGCGPAILFPELLNDASEYIAVDLVTANLEEITKGIQNSKLILVESDMDTFTWQQEYFDVIICSGSIEYTAAPEKNLLGLISYLKKGGLLICSFPNKTSPYRIWSEYVYHYIWHMKNIVLKRKYYYYPRRLFAGKKIAKIIRNSIEPAEMTLHYFGHKFILQPFDRLCGNFDNRLTVFFDRHPVRCVRPFCTEFLLRLRK